MPMDTTHIISFFFFNDTATTEIYTLSLHDALPILSRGALHEVRAPEPHERRAFDHEDHIRQRGKVRPARDARSHDRGDLRHTEVVSHDRVVVEDARRAVLPWEHAALVRQIHAGRVHEVHDR